MSARRQPNSEERRSRPREADIVAIPVPQQAVWGQQQLQLERIGDILRRTRERRGDNLQAIADYLCIRRGFLEALEESRYDAFSADAYVIGFLRSYAELLGLNSREAIDRYRAEMAGRRKKPPLSMPTPIVEGRAPSVFVLIGAVVAAILIYTVWYSFSTPDRTTVSAPPALPSTPAGETTASSTAPASIEINAPPPASVMVTPSPVPVAAEKPVGPAATTSAPAPEKSAAQEQAPAAAAPAAAQGRPPADTGADAEVAAKPPHLAIKAQQSSWVMVSDSKGDAIFDRVLKPGETYTVPDKPGLTLTTGNGTGITIALDGVDLPKLSVRPSSGIARDIPLDGGRLKTLLQSRD